ncbi:MAG: NAD(P)H-dependent oxidoreductase [Calditrichaeota bacterium]|nr:MAG: NAD(P)H-dependent oxidoreductase [Calditrichota bacterium]
MNTSNKSRARVNVVGISGSLREGSYTRKVVALALEGAREEGVETRLIDLREYNLVFYGQVPEAEYPSDVIRLRREVREAQGIILGTPEYHGSLSGVLKNALDLMGFDEFEGKMIGLVGVSGGRLGAINALNSLRNIGRVLHAWVLPQQVSIPEAYKYFDAEGHLTDPELRERLLEVGRLVARFAKLHEMQKDQEFIRMWEELPANPGGRSHGEG